jgi:predicted site-specific integrase-resolvase
MSTLPKNKRTWLTPPEAAQLAEVTATTILTWCKSNPKLGKKINKRWRINKEALQKYLNGGTNGKKK